MEIMIAPSILAADLACLGEEIARAEEGGCDALHVDIMDFHFVPNLSFGPNIVRTLRRVSRLPLDVHLMVDNPLDMIDPFADAGSDCITIHAEAVPDVSAALDAITLRGIRNGISFRPDTPVDTVLPYLDCVDLVLVMSVYPGFGGQQFMPESCGRVARVADAAARLEKPPIISVDGGVDMVNAPLLIKAGATCLVAGSSIFRDYAATENIRRMRAAISV